MKHIVSKFGGTSVADIPAMKRCAEIIVSTPGVKIVVVSATAKTTNGLEEFASKSLNAGDEALNLWESIFSRHYEMAKEAGLSQESLIVMKELFSEGESLSLRINTAGQLSGELMDPVYSLGERMSALIFRAVLENTFRINGQNKKVTYLNSREVMWTDESFLCANPLKDSIYQALSRQVNLEDETQVYVAEGFIGSTLDGRTTTFGREGSDFSAALYAEAIRASELQIWTDVPGIASADPRLGFPISWIPFLTFDEAESLALAGAKVLFPKTLSPVRNLSIPVFVGSSLDPKKSIGRERLGSYITHLEDCPSRLIAIASDRNAISLIGHNIALLRDQIEARISELDFEVRGVEAQSNSIRIVIGLSCDQSEVIRKIHDGLELDKGPFSGI